MKRRRSGGGWSSGGDVQMDYQQRAYYEAMRRSQDVMRRSSDQRAPMGRASAPSHPSYSYHGARDRSFAPPPARLAVGTGR